MAVMGKRRSAYKLPADKLEQREKVFVIYRVGTSRSIAKLERLLRDKHPELHVARPSLDKRSIQHDWTARIKVHDDAGGAAGVTGLHKRSRSAAQAVTESTGTSSLQRLL
jgi:hypothetical protein